MGKRKRYVPSQNKRHKQFGKLRLNSRKTRCSVASNSVENPNITNQEENIPSTSRGIRAADEEIVSQVCESSSEDSTSPCENEPMEIKITNKDEVKTISSYPVGRRLINMNNFFQNLSNLNDHKPFDCNFSNMDFMKETRHGLKSTFHFKCRMCNSTKKFVTDTTNGQEMDVNSSAVLAALSTGCGYSQLNQQHATLNMPSISPRLYSKCHENLSGVIYESCWAEMEEAGKEELHLARECGDVDDDNNGLITVVADGAWSKRSYKVNYDAPSGIACIVGAKTGKILFLSTRNKYCSICNRAETRKVEPETHTCFKNWTASSTSMEADIILEGFKCSIGMHKLKYVQLVGDGDSSVFKRLCKEKPYGGHVQITKVECTNHMLRNYCNRLRELSKKRLSSCNKFVPPFLRNIVKSNILRLRTGIKKAVIHRRKEEVSFEDKISNLKKDISNCPYHVFGQHEECDKYFCKGPKDEETNYVQNLKDCGIWDDIICVGNRLQQNSFSLLLNMNNNTAECYNSVVAKFTGGKRINFSMGNSYDLRCRAAALNFNTGSRYISRIHKTMTKKSPGIFTKVYMSKIEKRKEYMKARRMLFPTSSKPKQFAAADKDYGAVEEFTQSEMEEKKCKLLSQLQNDNFRELEVKTRGQSDNPLWKKERMFRLTASHFGAVFKLRKSTDPKKLTNRILNSTFIGSAATRWGLDHENIAKAKFQEYARNELKLGNISISDCGLYVDPEHVYLGASPDGLLSTGDLIEIKCPYSCRDVNPIEAIQNGKIKFMDSTTYRLKINDNYYYQVQGQMSITNTNYCYFVVWTPLGILVDKIERNEQLWKNQLLPKLKTFYFDAMIPQIITANF